MDPTVVPMAMEPLMDTFWNHLGYVCPPVVPMPMEPQTDTFWKLFGSMHVWICNIATQRVIEHTLGHS